MDVEEISMPPLKSRKKAREHMSDEESEGSTTLKSRKKAREHMSQLQRLPEKDPEFYQFLKEHAKDLLDFNDEDIEEDADDETDKEDIGTDLEDSDEENGRLKKMYDVEEKEDKPSKTVLTTAMVDSWCTSIKEDGKLSAVRSLMRAYRNASHYGDDGADESSANLSIMSSTVFNKIMLTVLTEMDGILRKLFKLPDSGGKKETVLDLMTTKQWKNYNHLVKSYLGNSLHVLNQMTDIEMISFTLRRLRSSILFLAAFPSLLRKYVKAALHFWGTGGGALPVVSFLFLRDLSIRLGSDCVDECFKGIYKAYVLNCQYVNAAKLQHIGFLGNCVIELLGVDLHLAYQHAFGFIRQLGTILREAYRMKTKEAFRKVYEWKFINCLELWTGAICRYSSEPDFRLLAYALTQIINGVSRLVPTARYFPLRLRCARMLNRISASTGMYIPVSMLLLDMLEMKELSRPPTGGVGKAVDLLSALKVSKQVLKTRAFQEACVYSVVDELAEHLSEWSYSVAFYELSLVPVVRLRSFCKTTKVERFKKQMRQLVKQAEANVDFTNERRKSIIYLPNDPSATSFLEDEKKKGASPLSQYIATLRQRSQKRKDSLFESSVTVGEHASVFGSKILTEEDDSGDEEGATVFNSNWLPGKDSNTKQSKKEKKKKKRTEQHEKLAVGEDIVEDLILSSDEDGSTSDTSAEMTEVPKPPSKKPGDKKQSMNSQKKSVNSHSKKLKKRKRATK